MSRAPRVVSILGSLIQRRYDPDTGMVRGPDRFPSTRHSLFAAVSQPDLRAGALAAIVEAYWKPVYKYVRIKWSKSNEDAKDITQDFFGSLLERDLLARWDAERASFRTYIRLCIDAHVKDDLTAASRLKRGGSAQALSLDFETAERELEIATADATPEDVFHREWQRRMFELAIADLRAASAGQGKAVPFRVFEQYDLTAGERPSYEDLAREHSIAVTDVTNYLAWARRALKRQLLERLASTTAGAAERDQEARGLLRAWR